MVTPSLNAAQDEKNALTIHVFGHDSANPSEIAQVFSGQFPAKSETHCDVAIFVINPNNGIDASTIAQWESLNDFMTPRIIVVTHFDSGEGDFDDAILLANRVFDQTSAPYLVLHDDSGTACALIELETLEITDYTMTPPIKRHCEPEHETLVSEFREEFLNSKELMGEDAFSAGLVFPAIPVSIEKNIGVEIVKNLLTQISQQLPSGD
jgi:hypothetical protein